MLSAFLPLMMGEIGMLRGGTFVTLDSVLLAISVSVFIGWLPE